MATTQTMEDDPVPGWSSIDWSLPIHEMSICNSCGIDSGEAIGIGHLLGCAYGTGFRWQSSKPFLTEQVKEAHKRQGTDYNKAVLQLANKEVIE